MLLLKWVAEVLGTSEKEIRRAVKTLGNVGQKSSRNGVLFSSDDVDRIKEFLGK